MGDFGVLKINYIACSDCSKDDSWNSIIGGDIQIVEFQDSWNSIIGGDIQIVEFQKWRVYDGKWNSKSGDDV